MPTYAYACKSCGHRFDAVQSFSEPTLTECPECGGSLRKEYGSIGVTFNGSGFYRTDSRNADAAPGADKKSGDATAAPASGDTSKSATKSVPEAKPSPASSGTRSAPAGDRSPS